MNLNFYDHVRIMRALSFKAFLFGKLTVLLLTVASFDLSAKEHSRHTSASANNLYPEKVFSAIKYTGNQKVPTEVSGKVVDEKGQPLAGVSVLIKGSNIGTSTNAQGFYKITTNGNVTLISV